MKIITMISGLLLSALCLSAYASDILDSKSHIRLHDDKVNVKIDFRLDSMKMKGNQQLYISPVLEDGKGNRVVLPALLINGRNMHYAWERGSIRRDAAKHYEVKEEVCRRNGKPQSVEYSHDVAYEPWMLQPAARITLVADSCGCGHQYGSRVGEPEPLALTPKVRAVYKTPEVTELPVSIHEGRARVQFEVDRTELHDSPYTCRNGQKIDNRAQLRVIDDSVKYALSDPNVEIASIKVVGYASPESPYLHNMDLSIGRSRALAEYLGAKYNLPGEAAQYDAVAENWEGFRELVSESKDISDGERDELLALIDAPAYGPSDYDAKERMLKTDKRFAGLYRSLILPKMFPQLRATVFAISTRLKPLSDEKLAEVIEKTPELMSLNQMMRVALLYPEGSEKFNRVINIALKHYPDDPTANLNAGVRALGASDYEKAAKLLDRGGDSAEAENARGALQIALGNFDEAEKHFENAAKELPEARENLRRLRGEEKPSE